MPDSAQQRVERLTPAQQGILPAVRGEWLQHGLSCEPADRPAAEQGVRDAYQAAGLQPPALVVWLDSPMAGAYGRAILASAPGSGAQVWAQVWAQVGDQVGDQVRDQVWAQVWAQVGDQVWAQVGDQVWAQVGDQVRAQVWAQVGDQVRAQVWAQVGAQVGDQVRAQVGDQVRDQVRAQVRDQVRAYGKGLLYGQHEAGYYSYYAAMQRLGVTGLDPINGQMTVARNAGWWWAYRHWAILTDRPEQLHRDAQGRLHHPAGMAIRYRDGWGLHAWHGRRVPPWVIEHPTLEQIAGEPNVEVRRCAIESLGWDRFITESGIQHVGLRAPDPGNPGQYLTLYDVPERLWGTRIRLLTCVNGSTERDGQRRRYGLTVPAGIKDPVEAAAWTYRLSRDEYARAQRRT